MDDTTMNFLSKLFCIYAVLSQIRQWRSLAYGSKVGSLEWIGKRLCSGTTQPSSFFVLVLLDAVGCRYCHGIRSHASRLPWALCHYAQLVC